MIGWIANAIIVAGLWQLGSKQRKAFVFTFIGEFLWCVKASLAGQWDLAAICAIFSAMAARNWIQWGREQ